MIEHSGPTLTDAWYRVGPTRPRLSPHARVSRHTRATEDGLELSYVFEDPTSARFYRVSESAYAFIGRLDGARTADEAWQAVAELYGDEAPTQAECLQVLQRLASYGLIAGASPLSPEMVAERQRRARKARRDRRTGKWFSFTIPLVNPEPWLKRHETLLKAVWSKPAMVAWVLLVATALVVVLSEPSRLLSPLNSVLTPSNLLLIGVTFLLLRAIHELGHATACKAMGGRSTEIGLILIGLVLPLPYCDASSAWRFPSTRRRVLVSLAGIIAESTLAAVAALVWAFTSAEDASTLRTVCFNIMLVSGVTTLFFNLNPLLRYDGYYILSDLTGAHNLSQRSKDMWIYLIERYGYGVRGAKPPVIRDNAERRLLVGYWVFSLPYRIFVMLSIVLLIATQYLTLGLILASIAVSVMLIWPLLKGVGYLASSPKLLGRRSRAVSVTSAMLAALIIAVGVIPVPSWAYAPATIEPESAQVLRAAESGHVDQILAQPGQHVVAGAAVIVLRNDELETEVEASRARLARSIAERERARATGEAALRSLDQQVGLLRAALERAEARVASLTILAEHDGVYVPPGGVSAEQGRLTGRRVSRGDALGLVIEPDAMRLEATLSDRDHARLFSGRAGTEPGQRPGLNQNQIKSQARIRGAGSITVPCRIVSVSPVATRSLRSPSLAAAAGGGVDTDPTDPEGTRTLVPRFVIELEPTERWPFEPRAGHRAMVRLAGAHEPLAAQWLRRLRQTIEPKLGL